MNGFSKFLNWCGAVIILIITGTFIVWLLVSITKPDKEPPSNINFILDQKKIEQNDSSIILANKEFISSFNNLKDSLNYQIQVLKEVKKDIDEANSHNSDLFKLFLALVGSVFVIVGFFGFKSINDVREAALKNAVNEAITAADKKAKDIAESESKRIAGETAKEVSEKVSQEVAVKTSDRETNRFLNEKFPEYFNAWENKYKSNSDDLFTSIQERLDKLERPESYGIQNKSILELNEKIDKLYERLNKIYGEYQTLVSDIVEIKLKEAEEGK